MTLEKYRQDFPVLQKLVNRKPVIYFDNACMTLKPRQVVDAMNEYYEDFTACAGRSVHKFGNRVTDRFEQARKDIAKFVGAKRSSELVWTRNTTEAINLISKSLDLKKGDVVLTSDREHNSNLVPWLLLERQGIKHDIVPSLHSEEFDLDTFESLLSDKVKLVSVVHTSNLDGYTLPVKEIVKIAHGNGSLVLLDGAQSAPHKEVDVRKLGTDFFAFSGHKMCGPTGTGALYGRHDLLEKLSPFLVGGDTVQSTTYKDFKLLGVPEKFEAGLQDYAGVIGFAAAARYLSKIGLNKIERWELRLNRIITEGVKDMNVKILGPPEPEKRGGIVSLDLEKLSPHDAALVLDEAANIMVRSGQHCVHSWFTSRGIKGSLRASFYLYNTEEEAALFVKHLGEVLRHLS